MLMQEILLDDTRKKTKRHRYKLSIYLILI